MINNIISFSMKNKFLVILMTFLLIGWGLYSIVKLPVDAVPDITNNQVQVISIAPTLATQEVEKTITVPIEVALATIPDIIELRSISRLGLSVVTVVFRDEVDIYKARQQVSERLNEAETQMPSGVTHPEMAPVSTGLGEIYQYIIRVRPGYEARYDLADLRTVQDWIVKRGLLGTPGVAEVNSYGGFVRQYEVAINPELLRSMNVSIPEIFESLEKNNENTGSAYIEKQPNSFFIRGVGLVGSLDDISKIVVKIGPGGSPILIRDVARVQMGHAIRYGAFVCDTAEAVGGVVMMLKGANASQVVKDVKERLEVITQSLPDGIYIEPYLDRTDLVSRAIGTVSRNLVEGGLIVVFVLVLMLGSLRAGLVVASVIPLSMLFAISMMRFFGITGNLMSLGAIDFGLIVDGAVIIVESAVFRISLVKRQNTGLLKLSQPMMDSEVLTSARQMMSSATFGQVIILIVYLPILTLVGIEGKMFRPMAQTVGLAILGALILSLTYVPVVSSLFLGRKRKRSFDMPERIMNFLYDLFEPLFVYSLRHRAVVLLTTFLLSLIGLFMFLRLGGEFIPTLEEGDLASGIMTLQGGSLTHTVETVKKANAILKENFPEVKHAVCKVGAGEIPTDPTPVETGDYIITMKDKDEWVSAGSREEMVEKMKEKVGNIPGVDFSFQQPISMRFNELMTGSKQDVAVKIFGDNLDSLAHEAGQIEKLIAGIEGVEDIQVEKITGASQISVIYNRDKIARYGLNISDLNKILRAAFAGHATGLVYDEEKRFDLVVRFEEGFRKDIENVRRLYIPLQDGRQIPLEEVAAVEMKNGTAQVSRENTKRRITVSFNVRNRDVSSIISDISVIIRKNLKLPPGYYITYGGQFENLIAARKRLSLALPAALILILALLYFTFHSFREVLLISTALPLAAIGGVVALTLRGMNFSISAGIGFIALFGVAVLNGIVLISEFNRLEKEEGVSDITERVMKGLKSRIRPVILTAMVASLGFLPMAVSTSAGAEVQRPLATVVIGGLISSTLLTLVVLPVLYMIFSDKKRPGKTRAGKKAVQMMLVIAGLSLYPVVSSAQSDPLAYTLQQAIDQALANNGIMRSSNLEVENRKVLRQSAWDFDRTSIGFTYGQMNSFEKDNEFTVSQGFDFPLTYIRKDQLARAEIQGAEIKRSITRNEIISQVRSTYYQLLYNLNRLRHLKYQDSLVGNFVKAARLKYEKGESNLLEKMNAESQQILVRNHIREAKADIHIQECHFQTILNEPREVSIADTLLSRLPLDLGEDSSTTRPNPLLLYLEQQVRISRIERQVETSKFLPDITVGYFNQSNREFSVNDRFAGIQAGIGIPILFSSQKGKTESARIREEISRNDLEYQATFLKHQLHIMVQEYMKYKESLDYYENTALFQADQIIRQANKSYEAGSIDYTEFVQNMRQGLQIREDYLETLNNYNQSVISIEYMVNRYD